MINTTNERKKLVYIVKMLRAISSDSDLHVVVSVECLVADGAGELGGADEDLRRRGDPVLPLVQPPDRRSRREP